MRRILVVVTLALLAAACGDNDKPPVEPGPQGDAPVEVTCQALPATANTCSVTAGNASRLLKGNVLTPTKVYKGGQVLVDEAGQIACVGCDCAKGGETTIVCPDASISPGLINTHDHITFTHSDPYTSATDERYDNRQQWREGNGGRYIIPYDSGASADQVRWGELRFVMGGATSSASAGAQPGLLRNLDDSRNLEGLTDKAVNSDTFPLDDSNGAQRFADCNYGSQAKTEAVLDSVDAYEPHTSEGIDALARNEFLCQTSQAYDTSTPGVSHNLLSSKTAMIHAIGLQPADYSAMAAAGTRLIWSPRSNIVLYGETARVTTAARLGVEIALGTDWMPSGSMNLLRELACADSFNATHLDHFFRDDELWKMVTINAAAATATGDSIGVLEAGKVADISIFAAHGKAPFRAVIDAQPQDVALVMRAGKVLYGDDAMVGTLAEACDTVDVCGTGKRVCTMSEVGKTYEALKASANIYPAFTCGAPPSEPSCTPTRPVSVAGSTVYSGEVSGSDSDGDGIANASDNCPSVFNPIRPVDLGVQGDADRDGKGDACDVCPLDANTETCTSVAASDRDADGDPNTADNCPDTWNPDQADDDKDGVGNACDACPADAAMGTVACPAATIYQIKTGAIPAGTPVRVTNALVTGRSSNGLFVQVKEGDALYAGPDHSGVFVFTSTAPIAAAVVGSRVTVEATVVYFAGQTELTSPTITVTSPGPEAPPAPVEVSYADIETFGPRAAALEGVIVKVGASKVSAVNAGAREFTLVDGASNTLVIDDFLFELPAMLLEQNVKTMTGILAFRQQASKLLPRDLADLEHGAPRIRSFGPALSYARVGVTTNAATFPAGQELTVTLTNPSQGDTTIVLTSNMGAALTVANLVIPDGQLTATVQVTAVAAAPEVTVTASFVTQQLTAKVRVLADVEDATTVTLSPATSLISANGTVQMTATLDVPPLNTATIALSADPAAAGTFPATVDIAAGTTSVTFTYQDVGTDETELTTVTAAYLASTSTATVKVRSSTSQLVINELDYDQPMTDSAEYVELYNPTDAPISLANLALVFVNGNSTPVPYSSPSGSPLLLDLSSAGTLEPHQFLVVAGATVIGALPTTTPPIAKLQTGWTTDAIQNGTKDGVALVDTATHTVLDALSYEGALPAVDLKALGFPDPVVFVEGTASTAADTGAGALCRKVDGVDTNNADADWKLCGTSTPGVANQ